MKQKPINLPQEDNTIEKQNEEIIDLLEKVLLTLKEIARNTFPGH